ncbi:MAG: VCBS repeat-containing protein [Ignavibacteria bacterium]|nr:VCBS repeat-containing protein [Ignavibacteria bacterium]
MKNPIKLILIFILTFTSSLSLKSNPINQFINTVSPPMNSNSIIKSSDIVISFTQLMNGSLMTAENIKVFGYQTGLMTASLDYNSVSNTLTINPVNEFKNGEKISVTLTSGLKTISNESITPFVYTFRSKALGGTGSFIKSSGIVSPQANNLLAGDIDSDGDIDLIINEKIYKNNGAAVFTYSSSLTVAGYSIMADFDNDGDLDIIVRRESIYDNYYFINDGFGNFSLSSTFTGGLGNFGDLNGDGFLDYCYYLTNRDIKTVFNINGNFIPDTSYYLYSQCYNNAANYIDENPLIDDLDNDGDLDVVGINGFKEGNSITFYNLCKTYFALSNSGVGKFTTQTIYTHTGSGGPYILFIRDSKLFDFNNDGFIDLISPGVSIKNNGTGLFINNGYFNIFHNSMDDDFNGDGFLDFITLFDASPLLQYFNNGDGTFTYIVPNSVNYLPLSVSADFDNDGDIDIAVKESGTGRSRHPPQRRQSFAGGAFDIYFERKFKLRKT